MPSLQKVVGCDKPEIDLFLPAIEDVRPSRCPHCGHPAWLEEVLWIVGHGSYPRTVFVPWKRRIRVRRFRCKSCGKTMSVLAHWILPYRRYCATVILSCLVAYFILGQMARSATESLGLERPKQAWGILRRWGSELLVSMTLWGWYGPRLGIRKGTIDREGIRIRLERLGCEVLGRPGIDAEAVSAVVDRSLPGIVYDDGLAWFAAHGRPESDGSSTPCEAEFWRDTILGGPLRRGT
ncbi:MAG: hypothetical protein JXA57_09855 [Armatimonadetes bacterium]|nr:hypothetical protein [Armatimonadota bacterium]